MTVDELKQAASIIKHETVEKNNTAIRIGTFLENLIDHFETTVPKTTLDFIVDTVKKSTSGIRKNMSVIWTGDFSGIPEGFVLSDGHNGVPVNGVTVPDFRSKFIVGYDPRKVNDPLENYGQIGNVGGESKTTLTTDQLPAHNFFTVSKIGRGNADTLINSPEGSVLATEATGNVQGDDNNAYKLYAAPSGSVANSGKTNTIGKGLAIENRPPYYVVYFITKVSDDVDGSGVYVDYSAGYGIIINKADPSKPIISVDTDKVATKVNGKIPLSEIPTNESTGGTPTLNEEFGGGRIHHIFQPGETGYKAGKKMVQVVANEDVSAGVRWSFPSLFENPFYYQQNVGTTSTAIGEGKNNTNELLTLLDANANPNATNQYAIKLARLYNGGGFTDWSLPSKSDLQLLSAQHRPGGSLAGFLGVTGTHGYWSSSEDGSNSFYVRLDADAGGSGDRSALMAVRCVRIAEYGSSDGVLLKSEAAETFETKEDFEKTISGLISKAEASETYSKKIDLDAKANKSDEITVDPSDAGHTKPADVHLAHGAGVANVAFIAYSDTNDDRIDLTYMKLKDYVGDNAIGQVKNAEIADVAQNCDRATRDRYGKTIDLTYATIDQLNNVVGSVYRAKGNVANFSSLPTNPANGDVYNLSDSGMNYAYTGHTVDVSHPYDSTLWDSLGGVVALATLTENGLLSKADFAILRGLSDNYASKVNGVVPLDQMPVNVVTSGTPTLGESFGGGVIFRIFQPGDAGYDAAKIKVLIAATEDASAGVRWSFPSQYDGYFYHQQSIGTTLDTIGEGKNNTNELLTLLDANANPGQTTQYAIKLARLYNGGGFTDWFLPSYGEAIALRSSSVLNNYLNNGYWTSSESNNVNNDTKYINLTTGNIGFADRSNLFAVRAIRVAEYTTTDGVVMQSKFKHILDSFISFASQEEAHDGNENTKVMTALRVLQSWLYQTRNYAIPELLTNAKTVVAALNDIYTRSLKSQAEYVLSGLDQDITMGMKVSETVRYSQLFKTEDLYLECTTPPSDSAIIVDIQKNGVSIFTAMPQIPVGELKVDITGVILEPGAGTFNVGDIRTISVVQMGISETGKNLVCSIQITKL